METENNANSSGRSKIVLVFAMFCAAIMIFMLQAVTYTDEPKEYLANNYYDSSHGVDVNQRALYSAYHSASAYEANACNTQMTMASNPTYAGNYIWIVDGGSITRGQYSPVDGYDYYELYEDGELIIAPGQLTFINANTVEYEQGVISIRAYLGADRIIQWDRVESWWCHMGKDDTRVHTMRIGAGGSYPTCIEMTVIGEAREDTIVTFYKLNSNGDYDVVTIDEFFYE